MRATNWMRLMCIPLLVFAVSVSMAAEDEYVLRVGDEIHIEVFLDPDLTRTVAIRPDGRLSLPFVGAFQAAGMRISELENYLVENLAEFYDQLEITVTPLVYANQTYYVFGDVTNEGEFSLLRDLTVTEGLAAAGFTARPSISTDTGARAQAFTDRANIARSQDPPEVILLIRKNGDQGRVVKPIMFKKFLTEGGFEGDIFLQPGDYIYVPENLKLVYVLGEVRGPGSIRWTPGLRVLDALADAGSYNEDAALSYVTLMRKNPDGTFTTYKLDLWKAIRRGDQAHNPVLEPNDTLFVPRNTLAHIQYFFRIFNEGSVQSALDTYQQGQAIEAFNTN